MITIPKTQYITEEIANITTGVKNQVIPSRSIGKALDANPDAPAQKADAEWVSKVKLMANRHVPGENVCVAVFGCRLKNKEDAVELKAVLFVDSDPSVGVKFATQKKDLDNWFSKHFYHMVLASVSSYKNNEDIFHMRIMNGPGANMGPSQTIVQPGGVFLHPDTIDYTRDVDMIVNAGDNFVCFLEEGQPSGVLGFFEKEKPSGV